MRRFRRHCPLVLRTIADLADRDEVRAEDVLEAIHYRQLDRQL